MTVSTTVRACSFLTACLVSFLLSATEKAPCAEYKMADGGKVRVDVLDEGLFRVRRMKNGRWPESGLTRYGIFRTSWSKPASLEFSADGGATALASFKVDAGKGTVRFVSKVSPADLVTTPAAAGDGFDIRFSILSKERIFGLGDVSRAGLNRNPGRYDMQVRNNISNIPVPMVISENGWGVVLNTTWLHFFDIGKRDERAMFCEAVEGDVDYYVFIADGYRGLLDTYTRLTGRSMLLPAFGFGVSFVCNQHIDQFSLMDDARKFRDYDLPCDILGLEPGWMEKFYDRSVHKRFDRDKFNFPFWAPCSSFTWPSALERIGFKLSLWLCCNYDLTLYEEQCALGRGSEGGSASSVERRNSFVWTDTRITGEKDFKKKYPWGISGMEVIERDIEDDYPAGMLPWFWHLRKFVDRGARCFKLDGANQLSPTPRVWANGMKHEEVRNLYPVIYDKQMGRGYEEYTSRRSMVYSAGGYAGMQQYVATWAGDTGGGKGALVSVLNLAVSGHSNQSSDMEFDNPAALHYAVLQPWAQMNNWDAWCQPWFYPKSKMDAVRKYWQLRYRLVPYFYTQAAKCCRTGWPLMRMLPIEYPEERGYDDVVTTYKLGDDLLVSAFTNVTVVPPGVWHEWRTGRKVEGPCLVEENPSEEWGGGLYVRSGAIIPTWPQKSSIEKGWNEEVVFEVWPSSASTSELYEDDGDSLGYRNGEFSLTELKLELDGDSVRFTVGPRKGRFKGMGATRRMKVRMHFPGCTRTFDMGDVGDEGRSIEVSAAGGYKKPRPFAPGERIAFVGDSITHGGGWVSLLKYFCNTRNAMRPQVEIINCGIAGDSGWNVKHRLKWDVLPEKPDRAFIMLGMNDCPDKLFSEENPSSKVAAFRCRKLASYRAYLHNILDQLDAAGVESVLVTPTPFDEYARDLKGDPCSGRNERGLAAYAAVVREIAEERSLGLVDFHAPMTEYLKKHPQVHLCGKDRVHPRAAGALMMALTAAEALSMTNSVSNYTDVSGDPARKSAGVEYLEGGAMRFPVHVNFLPMPVISNAAYKTIAATTDIGKRSNTEFLRVRNLPKGRKWTLRADGRDLATVTSGELDKGIDLSLLDTPAQRAARNAEKAMVKWRSCVSRYRDVVMMRQQVKILKGDPLHTQTAHALLEEWTGKLSGSPAENSYLIGLVKNFKRDNDKADEIKAIIRSADAEFTAASAPSSYLMEIIPSVK